MSRWEYRIVRHSAEALKRVGEPHVVYGIHEAYYDDKGLVYAVSDEPDGVLEASTDKLSDALDAMREALTKPVLNYNGIPEEGAESPEELPE